MLDKGARPAATPAGALCVDNARVPFRELGWNLFSLSTTPAVNYLIQQTLRNYNHCR